MPNLKSQFQGKDVPLSLAEIIAALSIQAGIANALTAVNSLPAEIMGEVLEEQDRLMDVGKDGKPKRAKRTANKPSREEVLRAIAS